MSALIWHKPLRVVWLGTIEVGLGVSLSHAQAREYIKKNFQVIFGRPPTLLEAQFAQAVSLGESYYGTACFKNKVTGEAICNTWNMGAVQCGQLPPCPANCFEATDSRGPEGGNKQYQACFRKYASPDEGFSHFLQVLYKQRPKVLIAANQGDIANFSKVLRESHYFELALDQHIKAMTNNLKVITKALGEPMPSGASASGAAQGAGAGAAIAGAALIAGIVYLVVRTVGRAA